MIKTHIMTRILSLACIILISSLFIQCSDDNETGIHPDLQDYFDRFAFEGAQRGLVIDYEALNITADIKNIIDASVLGECINQEGNRRIIVDEDKWDNFNDADREFLIFHELGHCALGRGHTDLVNPDGTCVSLMHSTLEVCDRNYNDDTRADLLDELFGF